MTGLQYTTLDFEILDIDNTKNIVFLDMSKYYQPTEGPLLEILLPGSMQYLLAQIQPNKINVLDSNTIGLSSIFQTDCPVDLPDGVYSFTYKICPYDYYKLTKYVVRTVTLDRTIQKIYCRVDVSDCTQEMISQIKKDLLDIYLLVESSKANASLGYIDKSNKDFNLAFKKVNKIAKKLDH